MLQSLRFAILGGILTLLTSCSPIKFELTPNLIYGKPQGACDINEHVEFYLTETITNKPIPNAKIFFHYHEPSLRGNPRVLTTNENGYAHSAFLPAGTYFVTQHHSTNCKFNTSCFACVSVEGLGGEFSFNEFNVVQTNTEKNGKSIIIKLAIRSPRTIHEI